MIVHTKDGRKADLLKFEPTFGSRLLGYLSGLSGESKSRFGPHPFTADGINGILNVRSGVTGYIGIDVLSGKIIAYSLVKQGFVEHDERRYEGYGILPDSSAVCSYAPSVHDDWQGTGLGSSMLGFALDDIRRFHFNLMVLWGGVQASNTRALKFYLKQGFIMAGTFVHNGENIDMMLSLK
ncbi:MAG: GNAT family N-acetyltransferase [Bacteroidota bacterium]